MVSGAIFVGVAGFVWHTRALASSVAESKLACVAGRTIKVNQALRLLILACIFAGEAAVVIASLAVVDLATVLSHAHPAFGALRSLVAKRIRIEAAVVVSLAVDDLATFLSHAHPALGGWHTRALASSVTEKRPTSEASGAIFGGAAHFVWHTRTLASGVAE